jgi:hypothetical protein
MAALAVDLLATVPVHGVVAGQRYGAVGGEPSEDGRGQGADQPPGRPAAPGEDAVITRGMAGGHPAGGAQRVETVRRPVLTTAAAILGHVSWDTTEISDSPPNSPE